jgi:hypothetical protein
MKKIIIASFLFSTIFAIAQESSLEKKLFGVQLGIINTSFQYEARLARTIALRSEIGLELGFTTTNYNNPAIKDETSTILVPYISLEPRWYYNIDKRAKLGRNIKSNSANYFSLKTSYQSNKTPIFNSGTTDVVSAIYVIPKFGIRRAFAKHFNYEFSFGVGYQNNLISKTQVCNCNSSETTIDLQARIGYNF